VSMKGTPYAAELISRKRVDGKFLGPGGSSVPEGQALLSGILDACFEVAQDIKAREAEEEVTPSLKPIYERLTEIKAQLERLRKSTIQAQAICSHLSVDASVDSARDGSVQVSLENACGRAPADPSYAMSLREIDSMRVDGKFVDANGEKAEGQYVRLPNLHSNLARD